MALPPGTHTLGPGHGDLKVKTYREGMASKAGHDLVIEVSRWEATLSVGEDGAPSGLELSVDPRSLEVREGVGGVKPLSDRDRLEIRKNIDEKVLGGHPIIFRCSAAQLSAGGGRISLPGELAMAGKAAPGTAELTMEADGRVTGTISLTQSDWGIKPYRGLMGALKVRDELDVVFEGRLPAG